jgi:hypothetical protein
MEIFVLRTHVITIMDVSILPSSVRTETDATQVPVASSQGVPQTNNHVTTTTNVP